MIRKAETDDLPVILNIYAGARAFMAANGNPSQWGDRYPEEEILRDDIEKGQLYVEELDGCVHGVFAFILGEDPTYRRIEEGEWISDHPYGTIHRVASDGYRSGLLRRIAAYCEEIEPHLRIDTHQDNRVMQRSIARCGFRRCGLIFARDGSKRIAYEKVCTSV